MFLHRHPYPPFIHSDTKKLIVGTLPPPRFSTGNLLEKDVDFCYGSYYNSLWLYIDAIHNLSLRYDNSQEAIEERKNFLIRHKIGVCDIVESGEREKIDASDLGLSNVKLRDVIGYLRKFPNVGTLLFTGGNSKNGPEYFFRKHIKSQDLKLELVSDEIPRVHQFSLDGRKITTVSLTSASGSANRAIGSMPLYKQLKSKNPDFTTFDFRVMQYREFF
ncbi:uracil-DNA glycosylase family protein [Winogradskyella poriferorum]|uniref:uracil-DNA glycosylase family protein n=1 Tax=Winogradskyella poriferorum TaxID=307627 RepID=UPI003D65D4A6